MLQEGDQAQGAVGDHEEHGYDLRYKIEPAHQDKDEGDADGDHRSVERLVVFAVAFG